MGPDNRYKKVILPLVVLLLITSHYYMPVSGKDIGQIDRYHDPIILIGSDLPSFFGRPVRGIRIYRYIEDDKRWEAIPFQIDEKDGGISYLSSGNGVLDPDDEIVFMARDIGDSCYATVWVEDDSAEANVRYRISAQDSLDGKRGWAYVFFSPTLDTSSKKYIRYHPEDDRVETDLYEIVHGKSGFQEDLILKSSAGGDGLDFLDRQKLRIVLKIKKYGINKEITIKEEMDEDIEVVTGFKIHLKVKKKRVDVTKNNIVRVNRSLIIMIKGTGNLAGISIDFLDSLRFNSTYYPTYYEWRMDSVVVPELEEGDIKKIRLTTDLNKNGFGMIFYNPYNNLGLKIDLSPDEYNDNLDWPGVNWYLIVADPENSGAAIQNGSIVSVMEFEGEPLGSKQILYYRDSIWNFSGDTGDNRSYGESGIQVSGSSITDVLNFALAYFYLPENLSQETAQHIAEQYSKPLQISCSEEKRLITHTIVINTTPLAMEFSVDGISYTAPHTFTWIEDSLHYISIDSIQSPAQGTRCLFSSWDNGKERCHYYTTPVHDDTVTANFNREYFLATSATPEGTGNVIPEPPGKWFSEDLTAVVEALPSGYYSFDGWTGDLAGSANPDSLIMDSPKSVVANFGNDPPVWNIPDTSFIEDDTLCLSFSEVLQWVDDNSPDSLLEINFYEGENVGILVDSVQKVILIHNKLRDWNGSDTLLLKATDPLDSSGWGEMLIVVDPAPDPPGEFGLILPEDEAVFSIMPDTIRFSWESSIDPDTGDVVAYILEVDTTLLFNSPIGVKIEGIWTQSYGLDRPGSFLDGSYFWRVTAIDKTGLSVVCRDLYRSFNLATDVKDDEADKVATSFELFQNNPNPFNQETRIRFAVPVSSHTVIVIYDAHGRRVRILLDRMVEKGFHEVIWDGRDSFGRVVSTGLYFILFQSDRFRDVKKAILLR